MTVTLRYLVNPTPNREELDFRTIGAKYTLDGKEYDYSLHGEAAETGNGSVNTVWTAPGISINAKTLLGSADVVLFDGQWSDYTKVLSPIDGTITYSRTVDGNTEQVTVADGQVPSQQDLLVFADGSVRTDTARKALNSPSLTASVDDLMNVGAATASPADDWNANITSSHPGALVPESPGGSIRVSASEAASFALPTPGVSQVLTGSDGVDQVYITPGAVVDARALLGGEDQIFLTGKWEDYTKSLDSGAGIITLTRTVDGHTETVIVGDGQLGANCDLLVFSDGAVRTDTARLALTQNLSSSVTDVKAQGELTTATASDDWKDTTFTRWGIKAPLINALATDDMVNCVEKWSGVDVTGTAGVGSTVKVMWGTSEHSVTAGIDGNWSSNFATNEIPADGRTVLSAVAWDKAGKSSSVQRDIIVDTEMLVATINPVTSDNVVDAKEAAAGLTLTGTVEANSKLDVYITSFVTYSYVGQFSCTADNTGHWSCQIPSLPAQNGDYCVSVYATDLAGNQSAHGYRNFTIDTTLTTVTAPTINAVTADNIVYAAEKAAGVNVTGIAEAGSPVKVVWEATPHTVTADTNGQWSSTFASNEVPADGHSSTGVVISG